MPDVPGLRRTGGRFGSLSRFRPLRQFGIPSQRIKEASTVDIPGVDGGGYAVPRSIAEIALACKFKHPKGLKWHHTFRIRAPNTAAFPGGPIGGAESGGRNDAPYSYTTIPAVCPDCQPSQLGSGADRQLSGP